MSEVIDVLTHHVSVRSYTDEPVSESDREKILLAAQAASSTCFLQLVSVVRVTDRLMKEKIASLSGPQPHMQQAPELWIFCADFRRCQRLFPEADLGWTEQLIEGVHDVGIMAQNAFCALESLGLGGVYAGGIRNHIAEVDELLELPQYVIPVLGLAFGHPAQKNAVKPRLPLSVLVSENVYRDPSDKELAAYDETMHTYYRSRAVNAKDVTWSDDIARVLRRERRPFMAEFLKKKGFAVK